jgi:O-antigen ligase
MRRTAQIALLIFVFSIPWEYSLDLGAPLGNVARIAGLLLLAISALALVQTLRVRTPGAMQWLTLALYLWFCCTFFWTAAPDATLTKLRGYFQEMMIVWIAWEFVESSQDLRTLLRAWLAGSWVLAILTIANFATHDPAAGEQIRFAAFGQDPNDVARYLDLGFPIAALLLDGKERRMITLLAVGYLPLGFACVLLTASRGGFLAAIVAFAGCTTLLLRRSPGRTFGGVMALPVVAACVWFFAPQGTLERIGSIAEQLRGGDLNQRVNIWSAGWSAFVKAPLGGHGVGSFVTVAGLAPIDTAHNTVLSILVEGGLCALLLAVCIVVLSLRGVWATRGALRVALISSMAVWLTSSLVGTVGESRTTWLLLVVIALCRRFAEEEPVELEKVFPSASLTQELQWAVRPE